MRNKWRARYDQMRFISKMRLIYGILILVPVVILECVLLASSIRYIQEKQFAELQTAVERNAQFINAQMEQCEKNLVYLASNATLQQFLMTEDDNYLESIHLRKIVSPLIYNTLLSNQNYKKIEVYSDKEVQVAEGLYLSMDLVADAPWCQDTMDTMLVLWNTDEDNVFLSRKVVDNLLLEPLGVIRTDIKADLFTANFAMLSEMPVKIQIRDKNQNTVLQYSQEQLDKVGYEKEYALGNSGWSVMYQVDAGYFSNWLDSGMPLTVLLLVVLLVVCWYSIRYSAGYLLRQLYTVIDNVNKFGDDNLDIEITEMTQDEVGDLARSINQMLRKIRSLIHEVYLAQLEQKGLELDLLRSKIEPHFLYNNLSAINWIAIENGESQIYEIATQMSTFYRTALSKGKSIDALQIEVENIRAYLKLQLMAHDDAFDCKYQIDERLMDQCIPVFVLQPLVENAIEHGLHTLRNERVVIEVQVFEQEEQIRLVVQDNGKALYEKIGSAALEESQFGYGLTNVHKRVQLLCGSAYGVRITAGEYGTRAEIRLAKNLRTEEQPQ